ncbi:MAG: coenzyme F420-0:L-glutamate ligase / coenzyme F420-1:gamma-L-glutamate ligase [Chloroflexi bacterium]|jgi:coenzyme F420-0:L-glutamate ligase/coenzyme F420-1:gamma-L-glutamate ligase|nr:MAG: coenzyme F420-0:L-glutamate ligase / coenzyme F420-1:gamma-L-glutamate ligase [Chloroflexota bacterium]
MDKHNIEIIGINGIPEIKPGDDIAELIIRSVSNQKCVIQENDTFVIAQKIVSKSEGQFVHLSGVKPSSFAKIFSQKSGRDPRLIEVVLKDSRKIIKIDYDRGILITETHHGFICANSGVDSSNVGGDEVVLRLPKNPDLSANKLVSKIQRLTGLSKLSVIISDTFGRPWREGHVNYSIGSAGIQPTVDYRGNKDTFDRVMKVTEIAIIDEMASAAELVMGKTLQIPVAIIRGFQYQDNKLGTYSILRNEKTDMFR